MKKLTSRKFWVAVGTAAYFAAMAIKEQGADNTLLSIVYGLCIAGVIASYIIIEGFCDESRIESETEVETLEPEEEEDEEEAA